MRMDTLAGSGNDEFYTPINAVLPIVKYIKPGAIIWCPFDTDESNFVKVFRLMGFTVVESHLNNGTDFFNCIVPTCDYVISNPPYSVKGKVLDKLFNLGIPFAMLVGIVGLFESQVRFNMFEEHDFEIMYFDKRISYFKNYDDPKPSISPPFSSVYLCSRILPKQIVFERISK